MSRQTCGNIEIRETVLLKTNDFTDGHKHNFDHMTYIVRGAVKIEAVLPNGSEIDVELKAGDWQLIRAHVKHKVIALEDNTLYHCIYNHRDWDGNIVDRYTGNEVAYV